MGAGGLYPTCQGDGSAETCISPEDGGGRFIAQASDCISKINGARKGSHRPKRVKDCLTREDSSDDEVEETPALEW